MASRSFGQPVTTLEALGEAVAAHTARAAEKIRQQDLATTSVLVFLQTNRFRQDLPQYNPSRAVQLPVASADTSRLLTAALEALRTIYKPGIAYAKAGVLFPELVPASTVQGELWTASGTPFRQDLMAAIDTLNSRFWRGTLAFGGVRKSAAWHLRKDHASPHFTTD